MKLRMIPLLLIFSVCLFAEESKEKEAPPKIGNFALPTSQQPAALFGFGGNIIDKGEIQPYLFIDEFSGKNRFLMDIIPSLLFGVTDSFSLYYNVPIAPKFVDHRNKSSGFEDFFVQAEYAFYNKTTKTKSDQATVVFNISGPTGSINKAPNTGFGSPSFFIGGTYYHTTVDWVLFTSHGAILTTPKKRTKIGNLYLYQWGLSRNIPSPKGWIYAGMLELDGQYAEKNRFCRKTDPNSGGNAIYFTPSLFISSKNMLAQFGISFPITQHLYGRQNKFDYSLIFNFAWSFY